MEATDSEKSKYFTHYFLCHHFVFFLSLVIKPSPYRWLLWLIIAAISYRLFFINPADSPGPNVSIRYAIVAYLFSASDYILLTDVQHDLRYVGQQKSISTAPLWDRVKWGSKLLYALRGVGWEHEPKSVLPPHPYRNSTRIRFVVSRVFHLAGCLVVTDALEFVLRHSSLGDTTPMASLAWDLRCLSLFLFVMRSRVTLAMCHTITSIVCVGAGISHPGGWPPMFGNWSEAYTIRRFWGRVWHQVLRRMVSSHGKYFARKLNCSPGSNGSSYVQLYTAFIISGLIHTIYPGDARAFLFFFYQAVAITFEDGVIAIAANAGYTKPNRVHKILGRIWVLCWFMYIIPPWIDLMNTAGALAPHSGIGLTEEIVRLIGYYNLDLNNSLN